MNFKINHVEKSLKIELIEELTANSNDVNFDRLCRDLDNVCNGLNTVLLEKMKEAGYIVDHKGSIRKRDLKRGTTLSEFLEHQTNIGEFIIINECGWTIGCTIIDNEDLFIKSLNPRILKKEVMSVSKITRYIYGNPIPALEITLE